MDARERVKNYLLNKPVDVGTRPVDVKKMTRINRRREII